MKKRKKSNRNQNFESKLEIRFLSAWKKTYPDVPIRTQVHFCNRQWRFDFAFPDKGLAIEIQGYGKGHASYESMYGDYEKNNEAIRCGWSILYFMSKDLLPIKIKSTLLYIKTILDERPVREIKMMPPKDKAIKSSLPEALQRARERFKNG